MSTGATSPSSLRTVSLPLTGTADDGSLAPAPPSTPDTVRPPASTGPDRRPSLAEFEHGTRSTWR